MSINFSVEELAVLLRCLAYGEAAISQKEHETGEGAVMVNHINNMRRKACHIVARDSITAQAQEATSKGK